MDRRARNLGGCGGSGLGFGYLGLLCFKFLFPGCGIHTGQNLAVHEITQAGGTVEVDKSAPDFPVVRVDFEVPPSMQGSSLARVRPHLEGLPRLRYLRITSMAMIADADLRHLEGLTQLETIELYGYGISKSSIERLRKKLPSVQIHFYDPRDWILHPPGLQLQRDDKNAVPRTSSKGDTTVR